MFFSRGFNKVAQTGVDTLEKNLTGKKQTWVRPPFATRESDFISQCTGCGDCIRSCPTGVIFPLDSSCGSEQKGTPALDLLNKSCRLCSDWPCVSACQTQALVFPSEADTPDATHTASITHDSDNTVDALPLDIALAESRALIPETDAADDSDAPKVLPLPGECPPIALVRINAEHCLPYAGPECGACRGSCPIDGALTWNMEKPVIDGALCVGCSRCREACIASPNAVLITAINR